MKHIFILILSLTCFTMWGGEITLRGSIYLDKNQNGQRDAGEPGIKNVLVSDGYQIVKTNGRGKFKIATKAGRQIFPILSSGYSHSGDLWWYDLEEKGEQQVEFGLIDVPQKKQFKMLVV